MAKENSKAAEKPAAEIREMEQTYTVEELAAAAANVFGETISSDFVIAALRSAGITETTKGKAKELVQNFMKKEVQ